VIALSKKVDYALASLAHLVENRHQTISARQIADTHRLPLALLMKILKRLHQHGVLSSTRGVKGGYQVAVNLDDLSLGRLIAIVDGKGTTPAAPRRLSMQPPVQALQYKLVRVLHDVKVTDLVKPGRRIDVPWERVRPPDREPSDKEQNKEQSAPVATPA
jgi:Rrf2 family protein